MPTLHINISNKIATYQARDGDIVCGNSGYTIAFTFDSEWSSYTSKKARFIWDGQYKDVTFTGNTCTVPVIKAADVVEVGVYAGDLRTSTGAKIPCTRSILSPDALLAREEAAAFKSAAERAADEAAASATKAASSATSADASAKSAASVLAEAKTYISDSTRIVQGTGNSETDVMSQEAVTEELNSIKGSLIELDGAFSAEFEIGSVTLDGNSALVYSADRFTVRTVEGKTYRVPAGTSFVLSDCTVAQLHVYYSYDGGATYSHLSRAAAATTSPIVMTQEAFVVIRIVSDPSKTQTDTSLADRLVVDVQTIQETLEDIKAETQEINDRVDDAMGEIASFNGAVEAVADELEVIPRKDGGNSASMWEQGSLAIAHGRPSASNSRIRTVGYIPTSAITEIQSDSPYSFCLMAYDTAGTYIGAWDGSAFIKTEQTWLYSIDVSHMRTFGYKYRLVLRQDANAAITPEVYTNIHFSNCIYAEIEKVEEEVSKEVTARLVAGDWNDSSLWEKGGISSAGVDFSDTRYIRTKDFLADDVKLVYAEADYCFSACGYDAAGNPVGAWDGAGFSTSSTEKFHYLKLDGLAGYKVRLMVYKRGVDSSYKMDIGESANIHFLNDIRANMFYPTPTLTFIDDDGSLNALENWESITDEIGVKITSALVTGVMGDGESNPQKASWADVARLQNKGYEFISHTHNHINITERTEETVIQQFEASIAALREHGCESRYLVYPYNQVDSAKMPLVKKYFSAAVGLGTEHDNTIPINTYNLTRYNMISGEQIDREYNGATVPVWAFKTLDELKSYIDRAMINGGWLIFMTHLRNDGSYYFDEEVRSKIVALCKYAVAQGMLIQTFGEAYQRYKNVLENGTVYSSSYYIADCNGVVHFRGGET